MSSYEIDNNDSEYLLGYDCSGSTGGDCFYHDKTQSIIQTHLEGKPHKIAIWDHDCRISSNYEMKTINNNRSGYGGTDPFSLVKFIINKNFHGTLILVTDGDVNSVYVQKCSEALINWKFKKVFVYLIKTAGNVNESVSCPFTRNSPHSIENYKNREPVAELNVVVEEEDFECLKNIEEIDSVPDFLSKVNILNSILVSINMGTRGNKDVHKKLVNLKNKLIKKSSNDESNSNPVLIKLIEDATLENLKDLWNMYYTGSSDWVKQIDKFISWCSGSLENVFDRNISNREGRAEETEVVSPETVAIVEEPIVEKFTIQCPITLENSTNLIILVKKGLCSIFDVVPDNVRESIINCPLNALRSKDCIEFLKNTLDQVISIEAYKDLVEHGISSSSPLTREDIIGGLCLGEHLSHVKATNSTIRHRMTKGKSLGNVDLWYAVYYLIVEMGLVPHLSEFLPAMREHMIFRLNNSTSYMCLSGLTTYPTYKVPLKIALWSVISASATSSNFIKDAKKDPLRLHLSYADEIIKLISLSGLCLPDNIEKHINRLKSFRILLCEFKKDMHTKMKIINNINALKYNAIQTDNSSWVMIDGKPSCSQLEIAKSRLPDIFSKLTTAELLYILSLCDRNKAEADIYIPFEYVETPSNDYTKNWDYTEDVPDYSVKISLNTCRPFYKVKDHRVNITWVQSANEVYGKNYISLNNRFGEYVLKYEHYPSKDSFLRYVYTYYSNRGYTTLPICVVKFVNEIFADYEKVMSSISVVEFIRRWYDSVHINRRVNME